jgi:hypothetical protein
LRSTTQIQTDVGLDYRAKIIGALKASIDAGADASARFTAGVRFDVGSAKRPTDGLHPFQTFSAQAQVRPPSYAIEAASAMVRGELLPTLMVGFYNIFRINASVALRVQADLDYATPDAVLCDVPYCGTDGFPLYVTWQPRLVLAVSDLRVRDVLGLIPLVGWVMEKFIDGDMRLIHDSELINTALTARNLLLGVCLPIPRLWSLSSFRQWSVQTRSLLDGVAAVAPLPRLLASGGSPAILRDHKAKELAQLASRLARPSEVAATQLAPHRQLQSYAEGIAIAVAVSPAPQYTYKLTPGTSQVFSFWVEDSTVPVEFQLYDEPSVCFIFWGGNNLQLRAYAENPSLGRGASDMTGSFVGQAKWTPYDISTWGGWSNTYAAKASQGFGQRGSYYYVK